MDVLQELLEEKSVTEIMVNGTDGIFLEKNGKLSRWEKSFSSKERILDIIQQITGIGFMWYCLRLRLTGLSSQYEDFRKSL